ncbi:iron chaperone [Aquirufa sp. ROCK-SH2]
MKDQLIAKNIDEYILNAGPELVERLIQLRNCIKKNCPKAEESISYGMPAFKYQKKPLCYFGVFNTHIGFFPTPSGISNFTKELTGYKFSKGGVQFPFEKEMPWELIEKMVKFRKGEIDV